MTNSDRSNEPERRPLIPEEKVTESQRLTDHVLPKHLKRDESREDVIARVEVQFSEIHTLLPEHKVLSDIALFFADPNNRELEFEEGIVYIEPEESHDILARKLILGDGSDEFSNAIAVIVAIGGVTERNYGMALPKHCFATIWYSSALEVTSIDFDSYCPQY